MAQHNGSTSLEFGEQSPLLGEQRIYDDSSETLSASHEDQDEGEDLHKANQQVGRRRGFLIILSMWGLVFLQAVNMSVITTIQSKIAEDLNAYASANWFTSVYLIAMSSTAPFSARLAQIFSPRPCLLGAALILSIGGIIVSQAPNLSYFLIGRAVQGLGSAGIMTVSVILVLELAGKKRRGLYIGLLNAGFTIGVSLGAVIAGALLHVTGWRFLFWIQSPFALTFGIATFFSIPSHLTSGQKDNGSSIRDKLAKVDYLGSTFLIATISLFLFGLSSPTILWIPIFISLILLVSFICIELYLVSEPIIPISVLRSKGALLSCVAQLGIMASRWSVIIYTPAYAIAIRGWSPASAGSMLIPTNLGFAIGGILAGAFHIKRSGSFWLPSVVSYTAFALSVALLSQISDQNTSTLLYFIAVFTNGFCTGAALNYALAHLLHLTAPSTHFISTSLMATFRGFAGSFGAAIGGGLFVRTLKTQLEQGFEQHGGLEGKEDLVRRLLGGPALVQDLVGDDKIVALAGYVGALKALFMAGTGLALVMAVIQGLTGRKQAEEVIEEDNGLLGPEDEEWEEGMENGV